MITIDGWIVRCVRVLLLERSNLKFYALLYLNAHDTYLAMFKRFCATVKGIKYLCVVKLDRLLQRLRYIFFDFPV